MSAETASEKLFEEFCGLHGILCVRVLPAADRTPDFAIELGGAQVTCEVKQIDPNDEDLRELAELRKGVGAGRYLPNRLRAKLKNVSAQLENASESGRPTLLVVYDNTPFKSYADHADVVQAMFGRKSVGVLGSTDPSLPPHISDPFFRRGSWHGTWPQHSSQRDRHPGRRTEATVDFARVPQSLRRGPARSGVFDSLPATQRVLPDAPRVSL